MEAGSLRRAHRRLDPALLQVSSKAPTPGPTTDKRRAFVNDLEQSQLIAASAASNRAKGDKARTPGARLLVHVQPCLDPHQEHLRPQRHGEREERAH